MTIKNLKKSNGFAASDALISILIITLFTGIIASLLYNIYLSNASLKRMSKANGYIVDVFEYIDKAYYDEVSENDLILYFNNKYYSNEDAEVVAEKDEDTLVEKYGDMPFKVIIDLKSYSEIEGNPDTEELDLVKEITMTVKYKLGNKDQELTIKRIKSREKLSKINRPDLNLLILEKDKMYMPLKK